MRTRSALIRLMKSLVAAILMLGALPVSALDRWTWQDTAWEASYLALHVADWGTTRDAVWKDEHQHRGGRWHPERHEGNPLLGEHPSREAVDAYFLSSALVHVAVARVLPAGWRRAFQASSVGVELWVVRGNYRANLSMRF